MSQIKFALFAKRIKFFQTFVCFHSNGDRVSKLLVECIEIIYALHIFENVQYLGEQVNFMRVVRINDLYFYEEKKKKTSEASSEMVLIICLWALF